MISSAPARCVKVAVMRETQCPPSHFRLADDGIAKGSGKEVGGFHSLKTYSGDRFDARASCLQPVQ